MGAVQQAMLAQNIAAAAGISVATAWKTHQTSGAAAAVTVAPASGQTLIVAIFSFGGSGTTGHGVSDNINGSTGWAQCGATQRSGSLNWSMWYLPKASVSASITTVTATGLGTTYVAIVHAVSGLSASPFTGTEVGYSATTTANPQTASVTNGTANSVFFAMAENAAHSLTINGTGSVGTWNLKDATNSQETNAGTYLGASVPNIIVSSGTAEVHGWTVTSSANGTLIAAFH